jgi:hypothetical protein
MARLTLVTCVLVVFSVVQPGLAQQPQTRPSRYEPAFGPTISPYLQYSRPRSGPLNNYYNFVRPRVQLRSTLRTQERRLDTLNRDIQRVSQSASQVRGSGAAPTGTHSSYMNFSHFYPSRR